MKKAILLSPLFAAILFTIPEAIQLMQRPDSIYIPVVFELLLLLFGYVAAFIINGVIVLPLCVLVALKYDNLFAGVILAVVIAVLGTTVAYAFEIFDYESSILHPDYLYPLLIPLFVLSCATFFFLTRIRQPAPASQPKPPAGDTQDNGPEE